MRRGGNRNQEGPNVSIHVWRRDGYRNCPFDHRSTNWSRPGSPFDGGFDAGSRIAAYNIDRSAKSTLPVDSRYLGRLLPNPAVA
jgi:hypothetical protein